MTLNSRRQSNFQVTVTSTDDGELDALINERVDAGDENVHTLLPGKAAHDTQEWSVGLVRQIESFRDRPLVEAAIGKLVGSVCARQMVIRCRVPGIFIDTVDDTMQTIST